jgi:hypothetical protein
MKIRAVGAEIFHAETGMKRRKGMTKIIVSFSSFSKALTNEEVTRFT